MVFLNSKGRKPHRGNPQSPLQLGTQPSTSLVCPESRESTQGVISIRTFSYLFRGLPKEYSEGREKCLKYCLSS